jgi:predicted dehydrogenase
MNPNESEQSRYNRRDFIRSTSTFGALMAVMGGVPLQAEDKPADSGATSYSTISAPVSCGVIGCGTWGREIIQTLAALPNAPVVAICDVYEPMVRRCKEAAPQAETFSDYHKLLDKKEVEGVIVATPSHQHREIVEAALKAGKHVYCEAPLASTIDDARAIAKAAKAAVKCNFQSGLQQRADPQKQFVLGFVRSGAIGKTVMGRSQWHKKQSWRRSSPNPEREQVLNWRLRKETSAGLLAEVGVHQLDLMNWLMHERPAWASGFGGILAYPDGRDVPDTVQSILGYSNGVNLSYDCTIANSFDAAYDLIFGTDAAVMFRDDKAWLFKEVDAQDLGWEVYARKDVFYKETGITLVMNASKSVQQKKPETGEGTVASADPTLRTALSAFITNSGIIRNGVKEFVESFGADAEGLGENLATLARGRSHAAGYQEGLDATITAIAANEAVLRGQKVPLEKEAFEI